LLDTQIIQCPYCWEEFDLVVDPSQPHQEYIEDCFVCCRPIHLIVEIDELGEARIQALSEDEDMY